jgi:hypothetical protein
MKGPPTGVLLQIRLLYHNGVPDIGVVGAASPKRLGVVGEATAISAEWLLSLLLVKSFVVPVTQKSCLAVLSVAKLASPPSGLSELSQSDPYRQLYHFHVKYTQYFEKKTSRRRERRNANFRARVTQYLQAVNQQKLNAVHIFVKGKC